MAPMPRIFVCLPLALHARLTAIPARSDSSRIANIVEAALDYVDALGQQDRNIADLMDRKSRLIAVCEEQRELFF